mmetsp:Transcript_40918/g.94277  ORF Transcript_40918/g.94277 Transcript_40918/m.94277 type:complete len:104 (-) Transcript_40918:86-397(-)
MRVLSKGSLVTLPIGTFYGFVLQIDQIEMSGYDLADVSFDVVEDDPWSTEDKSMTEARIGKVVEFAFEHGCQGSEEKTEEEFAADLRATVASWTSDGKSAKRR